MSCYLLFKEPMKYLVPRGSGRPGRVGVACSERPAHLNMFYTPNDLDKFLHPTKSLNNGDIGIFYIKLF